LQALPSGFEFALVFGDPLLDLAGSPAGRAAGEGLSITLPVAISNLDIRAAGEFGVPW